MDKYIDLEIHFIAADLVAYVSDTELNLIETVLPNLIRSMIEDSESFDD